MGRNRAWIWRSQIDDGKAYPKIDRVVVIKYRRMINLNVLGTFKKKKTLCTAKWEGGLKPLSSALELTPEHIFSEFRFTLGRIA